MCDCSLGVPLTDPMLMSRIPFMYGSPCGTRTPPSAEASNIAGCTKRHTPCPVRVILTVSFPTFSSASERRSTILLYGSMISVYGKKCFVCFAHSVYAGTALHLLYYISTTGRQESRRCTGSTAATLRTRALPCGTGVACVWWGVYDRVSGQQGVYWRIG